MAGRDLVRRRQLELESLDAQLTGSTFDVEQDAGQIDRINGCDRTDPMLAHEGEADGHVVANVQVALTILQKPADLTVLTREVEDRSLDLALRIQVRLRISAEATAFRSSPGRASAGVPVSVSIGKRATVPAA